MMVSSAFYGRIDPRNPAVFSSTVITGMIRGDLGFTGIIISDSLGAAQLQAWSPGARAVNFINAGGDIALTCEPAAIPAMVAAVTARAVSDAAFRGKVNAAALAVLTVKAAQGLLGARLAINGQLAAPTTIALQRWLGVAQSTAMSTATIRALQARIGTAADGLWGPNSMATMQSYLGTYRDGARAWNTRTVALLQRYLNTQL
jgi:beta-N-acetylhexosaminidase